MSGSTSIQWTDASWSPVVGCTRVSAGCDHCYAAKMTRRLEAMGQEKYAGLSGRGHFNGVARLHAPSLDWPLRWRGSKVARAEGRPSRIFVNPMSDLFHERLSDEEIAAVFGVMAACPQHTFQVLTKRPERALRWFTEGQPKTCSQIDGCLNAASYLLTPYGARYSDPLPRALREWPLSNVWLGVSVEDQATANERIPLLLQCPAAVRFVSYEPALGPVDFHRIEAPDGKHASALQGQRDGNFYEFDERLDWLIVGGESGPGARPFDLAWARAVVEQCKAAGVACFVKQLGTHPRVIAGVEDITYLRGVHYKEDSIRLGESATLDLRDRKGGDASEWPEDLRVREFPTTTKEPR